MISIIGNESHRDGAPETKPVSAASRQSKRDTNDLTSFGLVGFEHSGDLTPLDTLFGDFVTTKPGKSSK